MDGITSQNSLVSSVFHRIVVFSMTDTDYRDLLSKSLLRNQEFPCFNYGFVPCFASCASKQLTSPYQSILPRSSLPSKTFIRWARYTKVFHLLLASNLTTDNMIKNTSLLKQRSPSIINILLMPHANRLAVNIPCLENLIQSVVNVAL